MPTLTDTVIIPPPSRENVRTPWDVLPPAEPTPAPRTNDADAAAVEGSLVMIVDDEPVNTKVVSRLLQLEGYSRFVTTHDPFEATALATNRQPDLILLDLMMPGKSGYEILEELRADPAFAITPVVILTAAADRESRARALKLGAADFVTKPVDPSELAPRVGNLLRAKQYQDRLKTYSEDLEEAVRRRTAALEESRLDVIRCLARAAEHRDDDTGQHVVRVGKYARLVARAIGMDEREADVIGQAAMLHDVGKIGVPDAILLKPGKLTDEEFAVMQRHCNHGNRVLKRLTPEEDIARHHTEVGGSILGSGGSHILDTAKRIALTHHEWWDGTGYPLGLQGEDIPLEGRITAVADVFDALSSTRCYKPAFHFDRCREIIEPRLVDAFFEHRAEVIAIQIGDADES